MTPRLKVALHIPQELLPGQPDAAYHKRALHERRKEQALTGQRPSYGPAAASKGTPLRQLVRATLDPVEDKDGVQFPSEYGEVCLDIANDAWKARWTHMCGDWSPILNVGRKAQASPEAERSAAAWRTQPSFLRGETNISRSEETEKVVGLASKWIELDHPAGHVRLDMELALKQEVAYASFLSLSRVIVPGPRHDNRDFLLDYGRAINRILSENWHAEIAVRIPVATIRNARPSSKMAEQTSVADVSSHLEAWHTIQRLCNYTPRLSVALEIVSAALPPMETLARWTVEPVKFIYLPASKFLTNPKGYPVLSKSAQVFMTAMFSYEPEIILAETSAEVHPSGGPLAYAQYVRHLHEKATAESEKHVNFEAEGYADHLQRPLQPLIDDLEDEVYEGFEENMIKYERYESALCRVFEDKHVHPMVQGLSRVTVLVIGAGRGPLVEAVLRATKRFREQIQVDVVAVEKNAAACSLLQERQEYEWGSAVQIVQGDMRGVKLAQQVDIIVSELLGSFGDNELSPEIIDAACRFLKPGGVSIPSGCVSYLAPLSSPKLFNEAHTSDATNDALQSRFLDTRDPEQPYVVMMKSKHILSESTSDTEQIQPVWSFEHPSANIVRDPMTGNAVSLEYNARSAHMSFYIPHASVCHGFVGYFTATLYGGIVLSTHPDNPTPGLTYTWFPMYFPLKSPLFLPASATLGVSMWRLIDAPRRRVWYEWAAEVFLTLPSSVTSSLSAVADVSGLNSGLSPVPSNASFSQDVDPVCIKVGMSALHNAGGRHSYINL